MTARTPTVLKTFFETNDVPTQTQFGDLLDSYINAVQTSAQTIFSAVSALGTLDVPNGGVTLGAPTGGNKGIGTINVQNGLYLNGTLVTNISAGGSGTVIAATSGQIAYYNANSNQVAGTSVLPTLISIPAGKTIPQPNIVGVTDASNPAAGSLGELISATVTLGAAIGLTSTVISDITSIPLTAGDWDIEGVIGLVPGTGTLQGYGAWINTTSVTNPGQPNAGAFVQQSGLSIAGAGSYTVYPTGKMRINVSAPTTAYLSIQPSFVGGTYSGFGFIGARRVR